VYLNRRQIQRRLNNNRTQHRLVIEPFLDNLNKRPNNASVDLRLGRWFTTLKESSITSYSLYEEGLDDNIVSRMYFVPFDGKFVIHPGRFVLGITLEWLNLPLNLVGDIVGKSSLGRRGLVIETAPVVHPGFYGCLTLELANLGDVPLEIAPAMEIAQLKLATIRLEKSQAVSRDDGTFLGQRYPSRAPLSSDPIVTRLRTRGAELWHESNRL